jgi:hypothetical protein
VQEQRSALSATVEEVEQDLARATTAGVDPQSVHRELEAAGRAVTDAIDAHHDAIEQLAEARRALDKTVAEIAAIDAEAEHAQQTAVTPAAIERVVTSLAMVEDHRAMAPVDSRAQQLARAIERVDAEIAEAIAAAPDLPTAADVADARRRLEAAEQAHAAMLAECAVLTAEERAEIETAHDAALAAEDGADRGLGRGAARRRLAAARDHELAVLARFGFGSHIDYMLAGGKRAGDEVARAAAEQAVGAAQRALSTLDAQLGRGSVAVDLLAERDELIAAATELLDVDAGPHVTEMLDAHVLIPQPVLQQLADALTAVGVAARGASIIEAARSWVADAQRHEAEAANAEARAAARDSLRAQLTDLTLEQGAEVDAAVTRVDVTAARVTAAQRDAVGVEADLVARLGGDASLLQCITCAYELRDHALARSSEIDIDEAAALDEVDEAIRALTEAEAARDRASGAIAAVRARAQALAADLPSEPPVDLGSEPFDGLASLATALRAAAGRLEDEAGAAAGAVRTTTEQADRLAAELRAAHVQANVDDEPTSAEIVEGFATVLRGAGTGLAVLDDPLIGSPGAERDRLLEVLVDVSTIQRAVLLTDDPYVLGWAIGLPPDIGGVATAAALADLAADRRRRDQLVAQVSATGSA